MRTSLLLPFGLAASGCAVGPVAGAGGGGQGEFGSRCGGVAGAVVGPAFDDEHDGVIDRAAPRVVFAVGVVLTYAVFGAGAAELAEGDGVAAGFGEEVAAVAEGVCPFAQPGPGRGEFASAELPGGGDHGLVVAVASQGGDVLGGPQWPGREAGGVEGFGGVF